MDGRPPQRGTPRSTACWWPRAAQICADAGRQLQRNVHRQPQPARGLLGEAGANTWREFTVKWQAGSAPPILPGKTARENSMPNHDPGVSGIDKAWTAAAWHAAARRSIGGPGRFATVGAHWIAGKSRDADQRPLEALENFSRAQDASRRQAPVPHWVNAIRRAGLPAGPAGRGGRRASPPRSCRQNAPGEPDVARRHILVHSRAISSGVEHLPYKQAVAGSNPASPTNLPSRARRAGTAPADAIQGRVKSDAWRERRGSNPRPPA